MTTTAAITGEIRNMTALPQPILATSRDGRLVQIVALGDVEGHSPSCWLIDENGKIDLRPTGGFTVLDAHFLPPNSKTFAQFVRGVV